MSGQVFNKTLENGLKVLCYPRRVAPIVSVQVWYRTGSANERDGIRGISHFLEHLMFRGSSNVASEEHARRINDIGGHCNAFTAEDATAFINSVPAQFLEMVLELEADRMAALTLDPGILETERGVLIEEYHTYMNNPVAKAFLEYRRTFYGKRPYAISPLGELSDLEKMGRDDLSNFYTSWYQPRNAVVVIVGDFSDSSAAFELVARHFGAIAPRDDMPERVVDSGNSAPEGAKWMERRVDFDVPMVLTGYPAPSAGNNDAIALDIVQMILSQGETSRLHREVVRRRSIAVMAGGMNHSLRLTGMSLFFAVFTPNVRARAVASALGQEIQRALAGGVTREEVDKVRNAALLSRAFEMQSTEQIAQRLGYAEVVEGDYRLWEKRLRALETLDHDALIAAARLYWRPENQRALYLRPQRAKPLLFFIGLFRKLLPVTR